MDKIKISCAGKDCKTSASNLYLLAQHIYGSQMRDIIDILNCYSYPERSQLLMYIIRMMKRDIGEDAEEEVLEDNNTSRKITGYLLNDYIKPDYPICREERQYSLYLHNKIKEKDEYILKALGLTDCYIEGVYYEVTFMRDYWYADKVGFNKLLKEYTEKKYNISIDGEGIGSTHAKSWQINVPYPGWMMNAKPDIAVVLKRDNEYKLYFIECKYFSVEGKYRGTDANNNEIMKLQVENQENIIEFLCDYLGLKYMDNSGMENRIHRGKVIKVQFVSEQCKKKSAGYIVVNVNTLLK